MTVLGMQCVCIQQLNGGSRAFSFDCTLIFTQIYKFSTALCDLIAAYVIPCHFSSFSALNYKDNFLHLESRVLSYYRAFALFPTSEPFFPLLTLLHTEI